MRRTPEGDLFTRSPVARLEPPTDFDLDVIPDYYFLNVRIRT
jgi:hypothetical protein